MREVKWGVKLSLQRREGGGEKFFETSVIFL